MLFAQHLEKRIRLEIKTIFKMSHLNLTIKIQRLRTYQFAKGTLITTDH